MKIKVLHSETQAEIKQLDLTHVIIEGESCFVGRSQNSGLVLEGNSVSRLHGKFSCQDRQYYFCDLGSSNGSMVNGEIAVANQNYLLQEGNILRVGDYVLLLEAVPEAPEELPATVMGNLDATVVSGYSPLPDLQSSAEINAVSDTQEDESAEVVEAEIVREPLAIVRVEPHQDEIRSQTTALFTAINQRIVSELRAAGNLTRETYLKAIRKARESVEQNRLINPEQFEQNAEKQWQAMAEGTSKLGAKLGAIAIKGASQLSNRLNASAKAAWREFLSSSSVSSSSESELSEEPAKVLDPEAGMEKLPSDSLPSDLESDQQKETNE